jgi:hypothetical protein
VIKKLTALATTLFVLTACTGQTEEEKARNEVQSQKATGDTLEKKNLEEKRKREENPNAVRYIYLSSFGQDKGYYISKGKISSSGSQRTPEQDNMWTCGGNSGHYGCAPIVVDGAQDDGSYGAGDPGIFFYTADGKQIETNYDFLISDVPLTAINVPLLGGTA